MLRAIRTLVYRVFAVVQCPQGYTAWPGQTPASGRRPQYRRGERSVADEVVKLESHT